MVSFADIRYCTYADKVGVWGKKGQKYADVIYGWSLGVRKGGC